MKYRLDFITNSSSSTYLFTKDSQLTEANKKDIISYIEDFIFSKPLIKPGMSNEEINKVLENHYLNLKAEDPEVQEALKNGKTIYFVGGDDFNIPYDGIVYLLGGEGCENSIDVIDMGVID